MEIRLQIQKANAPIKHAQDTHSILQIAENSLDETQSMLIRMKELATQAHNNSVTDSDRTSLQEEFDSLKKEITTIGESTNYNGHNLLDGSLHLVTQTSTLGGQDRSVKIGDMRSEALGISDLSISSKTGASDALSKIDEAISTISDQRSSIGEEMNGLLEMANKLQQSNDNEPASESRIRDVNMEEVMKTFEESKQMIASLVDKLHQNHTPQGVLSLLR